MSVLTQQKKKQGFTIIEIFIVITIAVIIAAAGVFASSKAWLYFGRVDGASRSLAADLSRVQQLAIGKRNNYYLQFYNNLGVNNTQYGYQIYQGSSVGSGTAVLAAEQLFDKYVVLNENLNANNYIMFGTLGQVSAANLRIGASAPNPYYVRLQSSDAGEIRYVCVSSATGYAWITASAP